MLRDLLAEQNVSLKTGSLPDLRHGDGGCGDCG